jgi:hypothetical protein
MLERCACAAEPRLACDMGLVEGGREARRIGDPSQGLSPCVFMGGRQDHAVHVENDGGESSRRGEYCWHA